jgi:putative ABC transport system permease protein
MLRKSPAFTLAALLALALGIGANTAMFSVAYGTLLRPLPYADADRVAVVFMNYFPRHFVFGTLCMRDYLMWRDNNHAFEEPSLFRGQRMDIGGKEGVPEQVQGASVTAGFFATMGVRPLLGRTFAKGEDQPATASLAVLSESIWRRRFGASSTVLGHTILVNSSAATVIGVMPEAFQFPGRAEVWTNLPLKPPTRYGPWLYRGVARLKTGVTLRQAQSETDDIGLRMMQQNSYYKRVSLPVLDLREALLGTTMKPTILVLAGAVGLVLLIAVVNVACLMLARATVREREMALRLSLGAGRGRLVRQLLTESLLLSVIGGSAGLGLAWGGISLIRAWNPGNLPFIDSVRMDGGALSFMVFVSMFTGVLFGLAPALESVHLDLNSTIKQGARMGGASRTRARARAALVVCEIAVSRQILTMLISPGNRKYNDASAGLAFYDEVLRRARNVSGVETASVSDSLPPDQQGDADTFGIEGQTLTPGDLNPVVSDATVGPDFFRALGIPLVKGRYFTDHDNQVSLPVAIVSDGFARRFFPSQDVVGKRVRQRGPELGNKWMEIVGIVGNVKYLGMMVDTDPAYYIPFAQAYGPRMFLAVHSSGDAARLAAPLRREIQAIDPGVTLAQIETMKQALTMSFAQPRFDTMLLALFAGIALLLAAVGIYGLIAYSVAQRTHEIGVRMALEAAQADVMRMVVRQGASLAVIGILLGLGGAFALTRLLKTMLYDIGVRDALTFSVAPLGMMLVALLATWGPALRATRISQVAALRYD